MNERDWVDWLVVLAGAAGGFASLLAVYVGLRALSIARADRRDAAADRGADQAERERRAHVTRLDDFHELLRNVENLRQASGRGADRFAFNRHRTAIKATIVMYGLDRELASTEALTHRHYGDDFGASDEAEFDAARAEVDGLIERTAGTPVTPG